MSHFKLSASLKGHEDDVRAVSFAGPETIISASRDATVRRWQRKSASPPTYDDSIVSHGQEFVNAVTYAPPFADFQDGLYISGGKDTIIDVRQTGRPPDQDAERLLVGHEGNVCSLDFCKDPKTPYLASGSWDASARIWNVEKGETVATLEGHQGSVWAVLAYDRQHVITACSDRHIRVFSIDGKLLNTIKGSTDVVRALCKLPPNNSYSADFASAGNDSTIRLWTLQGQEVAQLHGHEAFIYSLTVLPSGELVSSSEDRTARIWQGRECVQTITHPAISVWTVAADPSTGDIVTGASDRIIRVFSRDPARHADAESIKAFDESVAGSAIPQQQMPQINKSQLPGPEFLQQKSGTKDGQVQMIAEHNGTITAHQWSASGQTWLSVGSVVDSSGSSGKKQSYMGQDYDYVFDVDIKDGKPPLKLPYNLNSNPHEAAQKFIADNNLPISYVEQTAKFIITNTQGASLGAPGSDSAPSQTSQPPTTSPRQPVLPQKEYLTITAASLPTIQRKIEELSQQLLTAGSKDLALHPSEIKQLPNIFKDLETALNMSSSTELPDSIPSLDTAVGHAVKISTSWPATHRIPGLDLLRCLSATPAASSFVQNYDVFEVLSTAGAFQSDSNPNVTMLATRTLANLYGHASGREHLSRKLGDVRRCVSPLLTGSTSGGANRNVLIAACTVYINVAVSLGSSAEQDRQQAREPTRDLLSLLSNAKVVDSEVVYRALVALGTLLYPPTKDVVPTAEVRQAVKTVEGRTKEPRTKGVIREVLEQLDGK
ncbi:MAG: hypothetical protein M1828_000297 [Chrysothrix sp. TS-e1954]|nr:MAG: hypothetical protein M1828_000297 [Chrysothrix sp. TS-e1954]